MCSSSKLNSISSSHCKDLSFTYFLLQKQQSEVEESYKNRVSCGSANLSSEIDDHQRVSQDFDQLYERMKSNGDFPGTLYIHCKYLSARFECNDFVISVCSHFPFNQNSKTFDTKGKTFSIR